MKNMMNVMAECEKWSNHKRERSVAVMQDAMFNMKENYLVLDLLSLDLMSLDVLSGVWAS